MLDPFCGGGSVLVESVSSGRFAISRDVNELAVLISKAKTTRIDESQARTILDLILDKTDRLIHLPFASFANLVQQTRSRHTWLFNIT